MFSKITQLIENQQNSSHLKAVKTFFTFRFSLKILRGVKRN